MKIVQISNFQVGAVYNLLTIPPEFVGEMGTVYQDISEHLLRDSIESGWRYEGGDFLPPLDTSSAFGRIITVLAYRKRFTRPERIAIKHASRQSSLQSSGLASDLDDLMAATYINLDIPDTIQATQDIEAATLIAVGRADEILSDPVYSAELPSQLRIKYGLPEIPTEIEMTVNGGKGYATVGQFQADHP